MRIGIVVHGPNIIDSGCALKLINLIKNYGDVKARLGGTMGRTAVIDAGLENVIDISHKLFPSDSLKIFHDDVDLIFLLNYGKSNVTGQVLVIRFIITILIKLIITIFRLFKLNGRVKLMGVLFHGIMI